MKNKLLVSLFAAVVAFAFTACKDKDDVVAVCDDLAQITMHKSARSLVELKGETLSITELEFASANVNDDKLLYRTIAFGNGTFQPKKVETMTYAYGDWNEHRTAYSLFVTPENDAPFTMWFGSNSFLLPGGRSIGGEGTDNTARVEKLEKLLTTFLNTDWEADFKDEYVMDSVFRDSIKKTFIPPMTIKYDTIKVFDHLDTLSADTTTHIEVSFNRNATTLANTGHYYQKDVRSTYDRTTKTTTIIHADSVEYDFNWYLSDFSSDSKFTVTLESTSAGKKGDIFNISKYKYEQKTDTTTVPPTVKTTHEFLRGGLMYTRPVVNP